MACGKLLFLVPFLLLACVANGQQNMSIGGFQNSCTALGYNGYCRLQANCTTDNSSIGLGFNATSGIAKINTSFLDLGRCIAYNNATAQLEWTPKTVEHWQSKYCAPCSQCTLDPATTIMTCNCEFPDPSMTHKTQINLNDHVYNQGGRMGCFDAIADVMGP